MHGWMQEDGIRLNHVLAAQLLSCYGAAGNSQQAERVMEELGRGGCLRLRSNRGV